MANFAGRYAVALAIAAGATLAAAANAADLRIWTGDTPSRFTLPNLDGANIKLEAHRGHVVLVHFFATWCEPCQEELPALRRLVERASDGTVRVLAISVAEVDVRVRRFFTSMPINFSILLDRDRKVTKQWNVITLPTTFVLDGELRPRYVVEGEYAWDILSIEKLREIFTADATEPATAIVTAETAK
ncbi:MAG: TlpA disulfide reductase family protein [Xanthobacteraceae bacterium]